MKWFAKLLFMMYIISIWLIDFSLLFTELVYIYTYTHSLKMMNFWIKLEKKKKRNENFNGSLKDINFFCLEKSLAKLWPLLYVVLEVWCLGMKWEESVVPHIASQMRQSRIKLSTDLCSHIGFSRGKGAESSEHIGI